MIFRAMLPFSGRASQERKIQKAKDKGRLDLNIDNKLEKEILNLWHEVCFSPCLNDERHHPSGRIECICCCMQVADFFKEIPPRLRAVGKLARGMILSHASIYR